MRVEFISYAAATLTTFAFLPQAVKALKEHDTHSLSLGMYVNFTLGVALWGLYGWLRRDWAIVVANVITGALCLAILIAKIRNDLFAAARQRSAAAGSSSAVRGRGRSRQARATRRSRGSTSCGTREARHQRPRSGSRCSVSCRTMRRCSGPASRCTRA